MSQSNSHTDQHSAPMCPANQHFPCLHSVSIDNPYDELVSTLTPPQGSQIRGALNSALRSALGMFEGADHGFLAVGCAHHLHALAVSGRGCDERRVRHLVQPVITQEVVAPCQRPCQAPSAQGPRTWEHNDLLAPSALDVPLGLSHHDSIHPFTGQKLPDGQHVAVLMVSFHPTPALTGILSVSGPVHDRNQSTSADLGPRGLTQLGALAEPLLNELISHVLLAEHTAGRTRQALIKDRDRIARDLHDQAIQRLFAIGLTLDAMQPSFRPEMRVRVDDVIDDLDDTIRDIRSTIYSLRHEHAALSLRSDLENLLADIGAALGFSPALTLSGQYPSLSDAIARDILAVVREGVSNAARHAGAQRIDVTVSVANTVRIEVRDDGVGFHPDRLERMSGLANLQARAADQGGSLTVSYLDGQRGTLLRWQIPISPGFGCADAPPAPQPESGYSSPT